MSKYTDSLEQALRTADAVQSEKRFWEITAKAILTVAVNFILPAAVLVWFIMSL